MFLAFYISATAFTEWKLEIKPSPANLALQSFNAAVTIKSARFPKMPKMQWRNLNWMSCCTFGGFTLGHQKSFTQMESLYNQTCGQASLHRPLFSIFFLFLHFCPFSSDFLDKSFPSKLRSLFSWRRSVW